MSIIKRFARSTDGNMSLLFGFAILPTLAAAGAGVDYSRTSGQRTHIQAALDSAVLAGVVAPSGQQLTTAEAVFRANLVTGVQVVSQRFQLASDGTLNGDASASISLRFGSILGRSAATVSATAAARMGPPTTQQVTVIVPVPPPPPQSSGACILVLDPTGSQSLLVNSGAEFKAPDCEVHVKSTAQPAAIFNAGISMDAKKLCIEGSNVIQNSVSVPNLALGCSTVSDPFAGVYAAPSTTCTVNGQNYSGTVTLNPGVYCGWFNFNGVTDVTFNPGIYVIRNGGWNVSGGSFKGSGITFYFADTSKIQFNSGMDTDITPPNDGPLKSVLFYEAPNLPKSDFIFNNAIRNKMEGLIYLPSRNVTFNADSKLGNDKATIVVHRLIFNNVKMHLQPHPDVPMGQMTQGTAASSASGGTKTVMQTVTVPGRPTLLK
jgi:Flp pilus assembly protein TadG